MTTTYDHVRSNSHSLQHASGSHGYTYGYIQTGSVEQKQWDIVDEIIISVLFLLTLAWAAPGFTPVWCRVCFAQSLIFA